MRCMPVQFFEWWYQDGVNHLKGIPGSDLTPPAYPPTIDECTGEIQYLHHGAVLSDEMIVCFLRSSPAARDSICRMIPFCTLEEQERLYRLLNGPGGSLMRDPKAHDEAFMRRMNGTPQVRTGPGPLPPGDPRRNGIS